MKHMKCGGTIVELALKWTDSDMEAGTVERLPAFVCIGCGTVIAEYPDALLIVDEECE
jgi:hypothetical protein